MSSLDARVMPFGKYKGGRIDRIADADPAYLRWVLDVIVDLDSRGGPGLYDYVREALARRGELNE